MALIPGLPDDIGFDCLVRLPHQYFPSVAAVCRSWNREIRLPDFRRRRKASGSTREVVVLSQARVDPTQVAGSNKNNSSAGQVYRLTLFEPDTGYWAELPPMPGGLPMFCRMVAVGLSLVVIGGWDPATGEVTDGVFVYDFVSAAWRRGAAMPGGPRSFFACAASDLDRTVYVAGGHDGDKCALRSALAYDVAGDEWSVMPDMVTARDEAKGVFHSGKFHVIGGYGTAGQGQFLASAESFDQAAWQWGPMEDFLDTATCPRNSLESRDGKLFRCRDADVVCRQGSTWEAVAELPAEVRNTVSYVTAWQDKVLVIGSEACKCHVINLKSKKWEKIEADGEISGHVQSGCSLEL